MANGLEHTSRPTPSARWGAAGGASDASDDSKQSGSRISRPSLSIGRWARASRGTPRQAALGNCSRQSGELAKLDVADPVGARDRYRCDGTGEVLRERLHCAMRAR